MKALQFVGSGLKDLGVFPEEARREAGFDLWQVQLGLMPRDFKPSPWWGGLRGADQVAWPVARDLRGQTGRCGLCAALLP